ncbi:hypothetical protein BX616_004239 [Lobosporangium transversale]|nr:hypothetical protein BX616_004239 [Lobosporangium transversale]
MVHFDSIKSVRQAKKAESNIISSSKKRRDPTDANTKGKSKDSSNNNSKTNCDINANTTEKGEDGKSKEKKNDKKAKKLAKAEKKGLNEKGKKISDQQQQQRHEPLMSSNEDKPIKATVATNTIHKPSEEEPEAIQCLNDLLHQKQLEFERAQRKQQEYGLESEVTDPLSAVVKDVSTDDSTAHVAEAGPEKAGVRIQCIMEKPVEGSINVPEKERDKDTYEKGIDKEYADEIKSGGLSREEKEGEEENGIAESCVKHTAQAYPQEETVVNVMDQDLVKEGSFETDTNIFKASEPIASEAIYNSEPLN